MPPPTLDGALLRPAQIAASKHIVHLTPRLAGAGAACWNAVNLLRFSDFNATIPSLQSAHAMSSLVACYDTYPSPEAAQAGWDELGAYYAKHTRSELGEMSDYRSGTAVETLQVVDIFNSPAVFDHPVLVSQGSWQAGRRTEAEWDRQVAFHHAFGWCIYFLLILMVALGVTNRLWVLYASGRRLRDAESTPPRQTWWSRCHTMWRRNIGSPAAFGYRHLQSWGILSVPTRIQAIFIAVYVFMNLVCSFVGYRTFDKNLYWPDRRGMQLARYVADRTGIMSFYNLPLLWLLAGRNDFLLWITGWSYQSCCLFHRWVGRIATLQAIVHSAAYTWLEGDRLAAAFAQRTWATGTFATVAMALILPLAIRPIRERAYEVFLTIHIVLAFGVLTLLFFHVKNFGTSYQVYLWACVGVWAFDRAARLLRILAFSTKAVLGKHNALAVLTHPSPGGFIRLAVRTPRTLSPKPGAYFFLYFAKSPFANHPFTLASWRRTGDRGTELHFLCKPRGGSTSALRKQVEAANLTLRATASRAKTRRQKRVKKDSPVRLLKTSLLLEGPYGPKHPIERYERILLIAGGSGISALVPYVFELAKSESEDVTRHVTVVWMVQDAGPAEDVLVNELRQSAIGSARVDVWVTATSSPPPSRPSSDPVTPISADEMSSLGPLEMMTALPILSNEPVRPPSPELPGPRGYSTDAYRCSYNGYAKSTLSSTPKERSSISSMFSEASMRYSFHEKPLAGMADYTGRVRLRTGRPTVGQVLKTHLAQLVGAERLAVLACGPDRMMDDLRLAVSQSYGQGDGQVDGGRLEYFEEAFSW